MGRAERVSTFVKKHDPKLYCRRNTEGKLCIYRESYRWESYLMDEKLLHFARPAPHFIMALTHNWHLHGRDVDVGLDPILARLQEMDLHNRNIAEELIKNYEKNDLAKERQLRNQNEDFLREFRPQFARTFNDVNTSSLGKRDRRRTDDKKIKGV